MAKIAFFGRLRLCFRALLPCFAVEDGGEGKGKEQFPQCSLLPSLLCFRLLSQHERQDEKASVKLLSPSFLGLLKGKRRERGEG